MANKASKILIDIKFLKQAVELIQTARQQVVRQTNSLMVFTYFHLGKLIVEQEQAGNTKATYGAETINLLSNKLTLKFGQGFSVDNLENMRLFYVAYKHKIDELIISEPLARKSTLAKKPQTSSAVLSLITKSEPLARKSFAEIFPLSWTNYVILAKIKNEEERSFYEIEATQSNWGKREL